MLSNQQPVHCDYQATKQGYLTIHIYLQIYKSMLVTNVTNLTEDAIVETFIHSSINNKGHMELGPVPGHRQQPPGPWISLKESSV